MRLFLSMEHYNFYKLSQNKFKTIVLIVYFHIKNTLHSDRNYVHLGPPPSPSPFSPKTLFRLQPDTFPLHFLPLLQFFFSGASWSCRSLDPQPKGSNIKSGLRNSFPTSLPSPLPSEIKDIYIYIIVSTDQFVMLIKNMV